MVGAGGGRDKRQVAGRICTSLKARLTLLICTTGDSHASSVHRRSQARAALAQSGVYSAPAKDNVRNRMELKVLKQQTLVLQCCVYTALNPSNI